MVNVRYAPKQVPLERLMGVAQGQPPWPQMAMEIFDGLPAEVRPMFDHAILPPPEAFDGDVDDLFH